jgi:hypothetical protein
VKTWVLVLISSMTPPSRSALDIIICLIGCIAGSAAWGEREPGVLLAVDKVKAFTSELQRDTLMGAGSSQFHLPPRSRPAY